MQLNVKQGKRRLKGIRFIKVSRWPRLLEKKTILERWPLKQKLRKLKFLKLVCRLNLEMTNLIQEKKEEMSHLKLDRNAHILTAFRMRPREKEMLLRLREEEK